MTTAIYRQHHSKTNILKCILRKSKDICITGTDIGGKTWLRIRAVVIVTYPYFDYWL